MSKRKAESVVQFEYIQKRARAVSVRTRQVRRYDHEYPEHYLAKYLSII